MNYYNRDWDEEDWESVFKESQEEYESMLRESGDLDDYYEKDDEDYD